MVIPPSVEKRVKTKARTDNAGAKKDATNDQASTETQTQKTPADEEPQIIHKCLAMLVQLLQSPDINSLNATLQTILDEFIKPSVGSLNFEIRNIALKALGAFSLRSLDVAKVIMYHPLGFYTWPRQSQIQRRKESWLICEKLITVIRTWNWNIRCCLEVQEM